MPLISVLEAEVDGSLVSTVSFRNQPKLYSE